MIELRNVSKYYDGQVAVQNLSFHVEKGETFGLIGTSGCGKTTTLKMINRLIEPSEGSITVDGRSVTSREPEILRRHIGYVIQNVGLFPHYTVQENITMVPKLLDWDQPRIEMRSKELLQMVGLDDENFSDRKPESLSGGQQQRVGLARALAADPPVILMDEPFGALDPITKQHIRREVRVLFQQIEKTIVLVTHDVFEAFEMCDRLCLLDKGEVQQIGSPSELIFQPANNFVSSFFDSDRFKLELLSVTLSDLLDASGEDELYWSPPLEDEQEPAFENTLYDIIDIMGKSGVENPNLIHRRNGHVVDSLNFTKLLSLFQQYKRTMNREGDHG